MDKCSIVLLGNCEFNTFSKSEEAWNHIHAFVNDLLKLGFSVESSEMKIVNKDDNNGEK